MQKPSFSKLGFLKSYVLPALVIFLIPGFGLWFFTHVESAHDQEISASLISQIHNDTTLTEAQREKALKFYQTITVSKILASNKRGARKLQEGFSGVSTRYAIFRWMKRIAVVCLAAGVAALVATGVGVFFSFRSQPALYWSLRLGWVVLRAFAVVQVLGQGVLAVALSFWVTAFWFERYYVKLIIIVAFLALCAVGLLVGAILRKFSTEASFSGRLLKRDEAPTLWGRISELASKLGIAPPEHLFVGIDDNFFVTEHPLKVGGEQCNGRTLFISLSLLKALSRREAEAVLAHELAHFSGEDTVYSRRISPLLGKYVHYLEALYHGGISRPVFYFMLLFWNLYQLALNKIRREREFRADCIGAELTSANDMAEALVKVTAYCRYREQVQRTLFEKDEYVANMDVFQRVERGFPEFMDASAASPELSDSGTAHPFDSHPPLAKRLQNLGLDPGPVLKVPHLLPASSESWFAEIEGAAAIEAEEWKAFEESFQQAHEESLAWRFKPEGEAEIQHVAKYFPAVQFTSANGVTATLDCQKLILSDRDAPVFFSSIKGCLVEEGVGKHHLAIDYRPEGQNDGKMLKCKVKFQELTNDSAPFLDTFKKYYARHLNAMHYQAEKLEEASARLASEGVVPAGNEPKRSI